MLAEVREDNSTLLASMQQAHDLCDVENVAGASLLETWIQDKTAHPVSLRNRTNEIDLNIHLQTEPEKG
jgi:hypothetical protein